MAKIVWPPGPLALSHEPWSWEACKIKSSGCSGVTRVKMKVLELFFDSKKICLLLLRIRLAVRFFCWRFEPYGAMVARKKTRSPAWHFFDMQAPQSPNASVSADDSPSKKKMIATCKICQKEVVVGGGTTNLFQHLLRCHKIRPAFARLQASNQCPCGACANDGSDLPHAPPSNTPGPPSWLIRVFWVQWFLHQVLKHITLLHIRARFLFAKSESTPPKKLKSESTAQKNRNPNRHHKKSK